MNDLPELQFDDELPELSFKEEQPTKRPSPFGLGLLGAISSVRSLPLGGQTFGQVERAITSPLETLKQQIALGGIGTTLSSPMGTALALGGRKLMETTPIEEATGVSQQFLGKTPRQLTGFPEPTIGAIGALGQVARTATPSQYAEIPKLGVEALFFKGGNIADKAIKKWASTLPMNDQFMVAKAKQTFDVADTLPDEVNKEIGLFRSDTGDVPIDIPETNSILDKMYKSSSALEKGVSEVIPEELVGEMGAVIKENPKANLGLIYKIKDTIKKYVSPSTWIKFKTGEQISPVQERLVKNYYQMDSLIDKSLGNAGLLEEKQYLDYLNQKATNMYKLSRKLKSMVVDRVTGIPVKTSALYKTFMGGGGQAGDREIFNQISQFEPKINEIIQGMKSYKSRQTAKRILGRFGMAAGYTGAGILGGSIILGGNKYGSSE